MPHRHVLCLCAGQLTTNRKAKKHADLAEREAEFAAAANEDQLLNVAIIVDAMPPRGARWVRQELPDGLDIHAGPHG